MHTVKLTVVPCAITASTITNMSISIGDRQTLVFPIFTYANPLNTLALCGPIEYEIGTVSPALGADPYLSLDSATRTLTYYPKSNTYLGTQTATIKAKSANFPLNTVNSAPFTMTGTAPCVLKAAPAGYVADRSSIPDKDAVPI
jgi:hypothetical protein